MNGRVSRAIITGRFSELFNQLISSKTFTRVKMDFLHCTLYRLSSLIVTSTAIIYVRADVLKL